MQAIYPNLGFRKHLRTNVTQEIKRGNKKYKRRKGFVLPRSAATLNILRHLHQQVLKCPLELSAAEKLLRILYQHLS